MRRIAILGCLLAAMAVAPAATGTNRPQPAIGSTVGSIEIPRLGVSADVIQGREAPQLNKGPSHDPNTGLPGEGRPILIAGHRTTFGAWFRHIDKLRRGDVIIVRWKPAYGGTIRYRVTGYRVVPEDSEHQLLSARWEMLALSACHPLGSDAKRWVVYAFPIRQRED